MRRRVLASVGAPLPYLRRVAYLESSYGQIIDTGLHANLRTRAIVRMMFVNNYGNCAFGYSDVVDSTISSAEFKSRFTIFRSSLSFYSYIANKGQIKASYTQTGATSKNILADISFTHHEVFLDDVKLIGATKYFGLDGVPDDLTSKRTIKIFGCENANSFTLGYCSARFYYVQIFDGLNRVASFIPVLDLSGRPAMYDEVSGQLFYNASGEGEFTWGELET